MSDPEIASNATEPPHSNGAVPGTDALVQDWLGVTLMRLVRATGLLQPDGHVVPGQPVSLSEGFALAELARAEPLSQRGLAERLDLEKSTVSRLVAVLERRGLVARRRDPDNRRYYQLTLTDDGRSALHALITDTRAYHARILGAMTLTERDALATGLTALLRAMGHTPHTPHAHTTTSAPPTTP